MSAGISRLIFCCVLAITRLYGNPFGVSRDATSVPPHDKGDSEVQFEGEAARGHAFSRDVGHGLFFYLAPVGDSNSPGISGWDIAILAGKPSDQQQPDDYSGIATPPYHFNTTLTVSTEYATKADDAVRGSRTFYFVRNAADFRSVGNAVNLTIYSNNASEKEFSEMRSHMAKVFVGIGTLDILDSHVTPGKSKEALGTIESIKFRVRLQFETVTTMAHVLGFDSGKAEK